MSTPGAGGREAIGFVVPGWPPDVGGVETHASELAHELVRRGLRVAVLALDHGAADDRIAAPRLTVRRVTPPPARSLTELVRSPAAEALVRRWVREEGVALAHIHHATGFGAGVVAALAELGLPTVVTLHDLWLLCPRGQMFDRHGVRCERPEPSRCGPCRRATFPHLAPPEDPARGADHARRGLEALGAAHRVLAPSAAVGRLFRRAGFHAREVHVVPNAVDLALAERARARRSHRAPRPPGARLVAGVLGAVQPSKGAFDLARVLAATGLDVELRVHGPLADYHGDSRHLSALKRLAARDGRIRLEGPYPRARLPQVLAELDLVLVPSLWNEVFGLSAREARAAGVPVLASDVGGLAELRGDRGVTLLPAGRFEQWVVTLARRVAAPGGDVPPPAPPRGVAALADDILEHYEAARAACQAASSRPAIAGHP